MAVPGRKRTSAKPGADAREGLTHVHYEPPGPHARNLEVLSVADLRRRVSAAHLGAPQRIDFHLLLAVTRGRCTHWVDFVPNECRPRSWIIVRPGQVQRFDPATRWEGWLLMFLPQFLLPQGGTTRLAELAIAGSLESLPNPMPLNAIEHRNCLACVEQIAADTHLSGPDAEREALLRHQLHALLLRLRLARHRESPHVAASARSLQRFNRFREAVDTDFATLHQVRDYAQRLGHSEKSLTRSTLELAGVSAKTFISQRIALEAKRLLVHTSQSVAEIAAHLGMDEPSNFVKFFKREAGCAPTEFRQRHR